MQDALFALAVVRGLGKNGGHVCGTEFIYWNFADVRVDVEFKPAKTGVLGADFAGTHDALRSLAKGLRAGGFGRSRRHARDQPIAPYARDGGVVRLQVESFLDFDAVYLDRNPHAVARNGGEADSATNGASNDAEDEATRHQFNLVVAGLSADTDGVQNLGDGLQARGRFTAID
ncbi:MAG TPA: hypothetical protein VI197_16585 [Polyangiaceae bacterium]